MRKFIFGVSDQVRNKQLYSHTCIYKYLMSLRMRKPTICICENKDADQLCSYCSAPLFSTHGQCYSSSTSFKLLPLQPGLCWTWSETQIVGFLMHRLKYRKEQILSIQENVGTDKLDCCTVLGKSIFFFRICIDLVFS